MGRWNDGHSYLVSVLRGGRGMFVLHRRAPERDPERRLELYELEACPFCRKVRETLSELDLSYVAHTMGMGSAKRAAFSERHGKLVFPHLVDPNTDTEMFESEDIIDYLWTQYGPGRSRAWRVVAPLNTAAQALASALRPRGQRVEKPRTEQPAQMLVLYNFEASPFCRKVREALTELDLDHEVRNVAKKGRRRRELRERGGKMMVPYLIDPNTDTEMYESDDIVAYLRATYAPAGPGGG